MIEDLLLWLAWRYRRQLFGITFLVHLIEDAW